MPSPTSANSVEQRCPSNRESLTIGRFTPISSSGSGEPTHETCESSSPRAVCPRRDSWNPCPSLVRSRDSSSHVCRLLRSTSLRRESEAHLFRGRREYSRSLCYLLRKDWRTGATIPFRLCAPRGIQTFSHLFLDSADMSKRNPVVRNPRGHFPFLTWFRRLGMAAVCGMGRALRFLGGPCPSSLAEGSGCLAGLARPGSAAPSMSEPAG